MIRDRPPVNGKPLIFKTEWCEQHLNDSYDDTDDSN